MNENERIKNLASYIVKIAKKQGKVSHLKLQKLLYYVDCWHHVFMDRPIFSENFQAWVHGPVLASIYKYYGPDLFADIAPIISNPDISWLSKEEKKLVDDVTDIYAEKTAYELECMTHAEAPWKKARKGLGASEKSRNPIDKSISARYYRKLLN